MTVIDGWVCEDLWPDQEWAMRTASRGAVYVEATPSGLDIEERHSGYSGASGRVGIPANVLIWLTQVVR